MITQKYLFGSALQDYYLDKIRQINRERTARIDALKSREDALEYIAGVRKSIEAAFPMPERGMPPEAVVTSSKEFEKFRLDRVIYYSRPGYPVTANLYVPKVAGQVPGVVMSCGHSPHGKAYDKYSKAAITFAEMGYAVLIVDPVSQGERLQFIDVPGNETIHNSCTLEHNMAGKLLWLTGEFFGSWRVYDIIRGLDYLLTLPQIDPERISLTGCSGGGTITTFAQAVEPRFAAAAPSCYITSWQRNIENELPADIEQMPPGILAAGCEMGDFLIAYAPRPFLIMGQDNDFFDPRGTLETYHQMKKIYELLGHPENLQCVIGEGYHGLSLTHREAVYSFFNKHFGISADVTESELSIPEEELLCTPTGQVMTSFPEAETVFSQSVKKAEELAAARPQLDRETLKDTLRKALAIPENIPEPYCRSLRNAAEMIDNDNWLILSRFALESEEKMMAILKYVENREFFYIPESEEIDLYVAHQDSASEVDSVERREGIPLALLDVRGVGELMPSGCDLWEGAGHYTWQYGSDYHYNSLSIMLNQPMLGRRVLDILSAIAFLKARGVKTIHLKAKGLGTIPAAIAALLCDDVADVTLFAAPESYEAMVKSRICWCPASLMLPGILEFTDLPEIYDAIRSAKKLEIFNSPDTDWCRDIAPEGLK